MAPKFALFTKGSKLSLNKGFKNMLELIQSCAQPSICPTIIKEPYLKGVSLQVIPWFVCMYNAIMHEHDACALWHVNAQNHGITNLSHLHACRSLTSRGFSCEMLGI